MSVPKKRKKRTKPLANKSIYRWLFSVLVLLFLFYLTEDQIIEEIKPGEAPVLYSNVCHDDLEKIYIDAITSAQSSILLIIYSLSDAKLIQALNERAAQGVAVRVVHDGSTPTEGFRLLCCDIEHEEGEQSGLMHQKILVIDGEKVWIGSANMTRESLRLHDNLVIGLVNPQLAKVIDNQMSYAKIISGEQPIEYWDLPREGKRALERVISLLDSAEKTIRIAMFTWTHPALTEAVIRAHKRGIAVEVILDRGQAQGVCQKTLDSLIREGIEPRLNSGLGLLHHKFAWIDRTWLINGSANWTQAAFTRNKDCFLILHQLTEQQNTKMETLWKKTYLFLHTSIYEELAA